MPVISSVIIDNVKTILSRSAQKPSRDTASETRETSCHPNIQVSGCCTQKFYDRTPAASVLPYHELFELTFLVLLYCWRYPGLLYPGSCECHDSWISQEELQLNSRSKKLYAILTSTKSARGHIIQNIFVFNKTNKTVDMHLWELMPMLDVDFFWQRETTSRHPE